MSSFIEHAIEEQTYWFDEGCFILELLNTQNDPLLSIARAVVPAGKTTAWHRLDGVQERYLIERGEGKVELEGLEPQKVIVDDVVVIPPGCAQRITASQDYDLVFLAICTPRFTPQCYTSLES